MTAPAQRTDPPLDTATAPLSLSLFGPMQVRVDGEPLPPLRSRKSLWLLALLTLRRGRAVERTWLAGTLWPDAFPERAAANLNPVLSDLRRALGPQASRLHAPSRHTLRLDLAGADVDVEEFDAAIVSQKPEALERAVALYRGPLLEDCAEEWASQERDAREQDCLRTLGTLAEIALTANEYGQAADYSRQAIRLAPRWEAAQRGLMQALSQAGDGNGALDVYQDFVRLLHREDPRAMPNEKTSALYARLRAEARRRASPQAVAAEAAPPPVVTGSLPHPLTDLVGREDERQDVVERLRRSRLVTLTGPGGIGKTRLAVAIAAEALPDYADGVWLVSLESLSDRTMVSRQIALLLGLTEEPDRTCLDIVTDHLRAKRLLLVLDNCEHILEECARVSGRLLRECVGVRVLATSRQALGITGETAWAVPSLAVPDLDHLPKGPATLARVLPGYESVQLFIERAQAVQRTFALTPDNAPMVAQVCTRLDGIPLAIEMAAARVRSLTVAQIAARLDDHLGLLTGGSRAAFSRQQTMRATLDWSYALLSAPEQLLLHRVSVFSSGWSLEAAESVCSGPGTESEDALEPGAVLDLLAGLVAKSLVQFGAQPAQDRGGRYGLLETVRQYGAEFLGTAGALRDRHLAWAVALVDEATQLRGAEQFQKLASFEAEYDNFVAALTWAETRAETDAGAAELGLRLAGGLSQYWHMHSLHVEGRQYLVRALERPGEQAATPARARALNGAGVLSFSHGDYAAARAFYEECLEIRRRLGDARGQAVALTNLGNVATILGDPEAARVLHEEALRLFRETADARGTAQAIANLANAATLQTDYATAQALYEETLALFRAMNDTQAIAASLGNLGNLSHSQADYVTARVRHEEAGELFRQLGNRAGVARSLLYVGVALLSQGDASAALPLFEEALCSFRELADKLGIAQALAHLGDVASQGAEYTGAERLYRESLALYQESSYKVGILDNLESLAGVLAKTNRWESAARLWGAVQARREDLALPRSPVQSARLDREVSAVREAVGETHFEAPWQAGRALTWDQMAAEALSGALFAAKV